MIPLEARDIFLYYGAVLVLVTIVLFYRRRSTGMHLRLKSKPRPANTTPFIERFSHIQEKGERPLNVVFNYNGHSWDAYEVLGLPAGSAPDKVSAAYRDALTWVDAGSRPFLEAAYQAIEAEWSTFKRSQIG